MNDNLPIVGHYNDLRPGLENWSWDTVESWQAAIFDNWLSVSVFLHKLSGHYYAEAIQWVAVLLVYSVIRKIIGGLPSIFIWLNTKAQAAIDKRDQLERLTQSNGKNQ